MAERVKYLGVTMEAATAEVLARLDAERRVPTSGLWLYTLLRAIGCKQMDLITDDSYVVIWSYLAIKKIGGNLTIEHLNPEDSSLKVNLEASAIPYPEKFYFAPHKHVVTFADKSPSMTTMEEKLWWTSRLYDTVLSITPSQEPSMPFGNYSGHAVVGGTWRLSGGHKFTYPVTEREKLVAIMLAAMQPTTLALGMNVVFDGKMKPQKSKINFSGTGGQIGEGDVLICHPDDLNRYSPLPGAVALVLGNLTEPVQAFTCPLPVGDEILTIVIK